MIDNSFTRLENISVFYLVKLATNFAVGARAVNGKNILLLPHSLAKRLLPIRRLPLMTTSIGRFLDDKSLIFFQFSGSADEFYHVITRAKAAYADYAQMERFIREEIGLTH